MEALVEYDGEEVPLSECLEYLRLIFQSNGDIDQDVTHGMKCWRVRQIVAT